MIHAFVHVPLRRSRYQARLLLLLQRSIPCIAIFTPVCAVTKSLSSTSHQLPTREVFSGDLVASCQTRRTLILAAISSGFGGPLERPSQLIQVKASPDDVPVDAHKCFFEGVREYPGAKGEQNNHDAKLPVCGRVHEGAMLYRIQTLYVLLVRPLGSIVNAYRDKSKR